MQELIKKIKSLPTRCKIGIGRTPHNNESIVLKTEDLISLVEKYEKLDEWRLALEGLTPMGSEFHNNLPRCLEFIQKKINEGHETKKNFARLNKILRDKGYHTYENQTTHEHKFDNGLSEPCSEGCGQRAYEVNFQIKSKR